MIRKSINLNKLEHQLVKQFSKITEIEYHNQNKVLNAFRDNKIDSRHFYPSTGYGYSDTSRDKLDALFSSVFNTEDAFVRPHFCSATHAITLSLRALLKQEDVLLSITGRPYDTIATAIGLSDKKENTLIDREIIYKEIPLKENSTFDENSILQFVRKNKTRLIFIQRSRGYEWRKAISSEEIGEISKKIKSISPETIVFVDNCYGEFTQKIEPTDTGADIIVGSLIKNPGGGLAPTGGYIAGKNKHISLVKDFFTSPGIGGEIGSYDANYRLFYQGFFLAPHTVAQAMMGAMLFASAYENIGFDVMPKATDLRYDITQSIKLDSSGEVVSFCKSIQMNSPVEAHVTPEPWDMPGYSDKVIMAAGTFIQGASIELSADAPIKEPYIVYLQGGLTYQHVKIALKASLESIGVKVV